MRFKKYKGIFVGKFDPEWVDGNWFKINQTPWNRFGYSLPDGRYIIPHDGFYTDFCSTPKLFRNVIPKTGGGPRKQYAESATIHDYLYTYGEIESQPITQKEADDIFLACLTTQHVARPLRIFMYLSVRAGGHKYFKNPAKLNEMRGN